MRKVRRMAIRLDQWIRLYKFQNDSEDIIPRETDKVFGRYFIA